MLNAVATIDEKIQMKAESKRSINIKYTRGSINKGSTMGNCRVGAREKYDDQIPTAYLKPHLKVPEINERNMRVYLGEEATHG